MECNPELLILIHLSYLKKLGPLYNKIMYIITEAGTGMCQFKAYNMKEFHQRI